MQVAKPENRTRFDTGVLRQARLSRNFTLKQVAYKMGVSAPQVQRVESGERRLTVDFLEAYCDAVGINILDLYQAEALVPIIGVMDDNSNVLPVPAGTPTTVRAPHIISHPERLAGVRWHGRSRFQMMEGHVLFFLTDTVGIPEDSWNKRCIMRRVDGTQRLGWPHREDGQIHITDAGHDPELNVKLEWASPILCVVAPQLLE